MATYWKQDGLRIWAIVSICWIIGMGVYQYREAERANAPQGLTIALSEDATLRLEAQPQPDSKDTIRRLSWVFVPPLLLLVLLPLGDWLARGFKPGTS